MRRYFFHVMNSKVFIDHIGAEFPDLESARREAVRATGEMLSKEGETWKGKACEMIVADEEGTIVFGVTCATDRHGF